MQINGIHGLTGIWLSLVPWVRSSGPNSTSAAMSSLYLCRTRILWMYIRFSSLIPPAFHIQQAAVRFVDEGLVDEVVCLKGADGVAAEAALEGVDAPEFALLVTFILSEIVGDATEVVVPAVMGFRPLHACPLQEVVGHEVALFVGGRAVHVPAPLTQAEDDSTGG